MIINLLFQESQCTHGVCIDKAGMEAMRSAYCAYDGSQCWAAAYKSYSQGNPVRQSLLLLLLSISECFCWTFWSTFYYLFLNFAVSYFITFMKS